MFSSLATGNGAESELVHEVIDSSHQPDAHVQQILKQAHQELLQLMQRRSDLMKRIGILKQTIAGLMDLLGDNAPNHEFLDFISKSTGQKRRPGFTDACRKVLSESRQPLNAVEICHNIQERQPQLLSSHKDPIASVTTVLNRLVSYGEVAAVISNGRRAWRWIAEEK